MSSPLPLAEEHPPARCRLGCVAAAIIVAPSWRRRLCRLHGSAAGMDLGGPVCHATAGGETVTFSPEQMDNAGTIVGIAMGRGLPGMGPSLSRRPSRRASCATSTTGQGLARPVPAASLHGVGHAGGDPRSEYSTNTSMTSRHRARVGERRCHRGCAGGAAQRLPDAYGDHEREGRAIASTLSGTLLQSAPSTDAPSGTPRPRTSSAIWNASSD